MTVDQLLERLRRLHRHWLRLRRPFCRCACHQPNDWNDWFWPADEGTPTHHGWACCDQFIGTANDGWGSHYRDAW